MARFRNQDAAVHEHQRGGEVQSVGEDGKLVGPAVALMQTGPATTVELDQPIGPAANEDDSPPYVMIALTTVLVAGGCLYLLFRRGSIAYRARQDDERSSES